MKVDKGRESTFTQTAPYMSEEVGQEAKKNMKTDGAFSAHEQESRDATVKDSQAGNEGHIERKETGSAQLGSLPSPLGRGGGRTCYEQRFAQS